MSTLSKSNIGSGPGPVRPFGPVSYVSMTVTGIEDLRGIVPLMFVTFGLWDKNLLYSSFLVLFGFTDCGSWPC